LVALLFGGAAPGCSDASRMFTGRWVARAPLEETWLTGKPELAIGHFGPELTGVAYYFESLGAVPDPLCPCAFIDHKEVDLDRAELTATTERCGVGPTLIWFLELDEDGDGNPFLTGTVGPDDTQRAHIDLDLVDAFVPEDLRVCE